MTTTTNKLKDNNRKGWQCPVCKRGVAPTVEFCDCVAKPVQVGPFYPYPYPHWYQRYWIGDPPYPYWGTFISDNTSDSVIFSSDNVRLGWNTDTAEAPNGYTITNVLLGN